MDIVYNAEKLAEKAHAGQTRKDGVTPYIVHPRRVAKRLADLGESRISKNVICMALLHDVKEDAPWVTDEEIVRATNEEVLRGVWDLTNPSKQFKPSAEQLRLPKGGVRGLKKQMDRDHIRGLPWDRKVVKLADRLDNVTDMGGVERDFRLLYAGESLLLLEVLRGTHGGLEEELEKAIGQLRKR